MRARFGSLLGLVVLLGVWEVAQTDLLRAPAGEDPLVFLHRAGGAAWPQNSRTAVREALRAFDSQDADARFDGLEVDIVLTKDSVPVLAHDPWVHTALCQTTAGEDVSERVLIRDLSLRELVSGYLCGGRPDPEFPTIVPVAEPVLTFRELIASVQGTPGLALYLDVKIEDGLTASASEVAPAVLGSWRSAGVTNPLFIELPNAVAVQAFSAELGRLGWDDARPSLLLSYPPFGAEGGWTRDALAVRWATLAGFASPAPAAREAGAQGVVAPTQVLPWRGVRRAADQGIGAILFTVNKPKSLQRHCDWPLLGVITDEPGLGGCPAPSP